MKIESLVESYDRCLEVLQLLEENRMYVNQNPKCEPQLGRRGLYRAVAGHQEKQSRELAMLWTLNGSDGSSTLLDIAERADIPFRHLRAAAIELERVGLLRECAVTRSVNI